MEEEKKSVVDVIYNMYDIVVAMQKKIEVLEKNNAVLTDLILKTKVISAMPMPTSAPRDKSSVEVPAPSPIPTVEIAAAKANPSISIPKKDEGMVKVFGTVTDSIGIGQKNSMVSDVDPATGSPIRTVKSNSLGDWSMMVSPGDHIFLANLNGNSHKVSKVKIIQGVKELRVDFK